MYLSSKDAVVKSLEQNLYPEINDYAFCKDVLVIIIILKTMITIFNMPKLKIYHGPVQNYLKETKFIWTNIKTKHPK